MTVDERAGLVNFSNGVPGVAVPALGTAGLLALAVSVHASVHACSNVLVAGKDLVDPAIVHGTVLERLMPVPRNQNQAIFGAKSIIQSLAVPVGANPAPTIWLSMAELKNAVYYFKPLVILATALDVQEIAVDLLHMLDWREIRVRDIVVKPVDMVSLRVTGGTPITSDKTAKKILTEIAKPTSGEMEMKVHFVP